MDNANYYLLGYAYGLMAKRAMRGDPGEHAQKIYSDLSSWDGLKMAAERDSSGPFYADVQ